MLSALRWTTFAILLFGLLACRDGGHHAETGSRALGDSIERGYEQLRQAYTAAGDALPPSLRDMYGAMDRMHGRMMQGHRQGMGMRGQGMMRGRQGRKGGGQGAQMWEWHQQMMAMHAEMAQMHEQGGRADLAARHAQMQQRHRRMMESYSSEEASAPSGRPEEAPEDAVLNGATLYEQNCASCHGWEGQGFGTFPPLSGASWVTGDGDVPIRILLHGLQGSIEVQNQTYDGVMPAFGNRLRDEEIAAILTYVRSSWGSEAEAIETEEVRALRDRHADRTQSWAPSELNEGGD